jgi:hypothetical protein
MLSYLSHITPTAVSALAYVWNNRAKMNDSAQSKTQTDVDKYAQSKKVLWDVTAGALAVLAFAKFGSKLGDNKVGAAVLTAVVLSGSLEHGAVAASLLTNGAGAMKALKGRNYQALATSVIACGATLAASARPTRSYVWGKVAPWVGQ